MARLRRSKPGTPIALRADDLVALSSALGRPSEDVEQRIVEILGCTPHEAHSLHAEMLRRKLVVPVAGLVAGLAVVTGVGIGVTNASADRTRATGVQIEAAGDRARERAADDRRRRRRTGGRARDHDAADRGARPNPRAGARRGVGTGRSDGARAGGARAPRKPPSRRRTRRPAPVIAPDDTPMGVPPNETVTIIQP